MPSDPATCYAAAAACVALAAAALYWVYSGR